MERLIREITGIEREALEEWKKSNNTEFSLPSVGPYGFKTCWTKNGTLSVTMIDLGLNEVCWHWESRDLRARDSLLTRCKLFLNRCWEFLTIGIR